MKNRFKLSICQNLLELVLLHKIRRSKILVIKKCIILLQVPFGSCAIQATTTDSNNDSIDTEYILYWNSQSVSPFVHKLDQVEMICRLNTYGSLQVSAVVIQASDNPSVRDPNPGNFVVTPDLKLEISYVPFVDGNKQDNTALINTPTAVTNTAGGLLGTTALSYTG